MEPPGCGALFTPLLLLLLCHSAVTGGDHSTPFPPTSTTLSTSFPGNASLKELKPLSESTTNLNASSDGDGRLNQNVNGTKYSTEASASPETAAGNVSYSPEASNDTSAAGNLTVSRDGAPGDNHTLSTQSASTTSFTPTTSAPKAGPVVSISVVPKTTWTSFTSTRPPISTSTADGSTSSVVTTPQTTPQTRSRFTTAVVKSTSASSTSQSTERSTQQSSTSVLSKARENSPSELNVGDNESTSSMDPLLVGLVSVFVVTAAAISLLIFLRFRRKNEQPEFRRLQDLPMDDMMEDTPLSMYSY